MGGGNRKPNEPENEKNPLERPVKPPAEAEFDAADNMLDETDKAAEKKNTGSQDGRGAGDNPAAQKVEPGMEVKLGGEKWKIDNLVPDKGLVVLKQEGRGRGFAVIGEITTPEELKEKYVETEVGGRKLYSLKGDKKGAAYEVVPGLSGEGKVQLFPRHDFRFVSSDEIKGVLEAQQRVERVQRMADALRFPKGKEVNYDYENWKVAEVLGDKGRVLLHNPEHGKDYALVTTSVTKEQLEKDYTKVQVGKDELYISEKGQVMQRSPMPQRGDKIQLWPKHEYEAPTFGQLDAAIAAQEKAAAKAAKPAETAKAEKPAGEKKAPGAAESVKPGDHFDVDGEKLVVAEVDKTGKYALIEEKPGNRPARVINPSIEEMTRDFKPLEVGDKVYYINDSTGEVYEPTGNGRELKEVQNRSAWPVKDLKVAASEEFKDIFKAVDANDKVGGEREINGHKVKVTSDGPMRTLNIDGKDYRLFGSSWFSHDFTGPNGKVLPHGDVKIHVYGKDPKDLAKVQAELIPELIRATEPGGPLHGKLGGFKTHDPMHMVKDGWENVTPINDGRSDKFMPGPTGQNAKGFTIYPRDAEAAKQVQEYLGKFLAERGLRMDEKVDSKNVGDRSLDKSSNRVSLERDLYEVGIVGKGEQGALLPAEQEAAIKEFAEKKVAAGAKGWEQFKSAADLYTDESRTMLKDAVLKQLNQEFRLDPRLCSLAYADAVPGETQRRVMLVSNDGSHNHKGSYYLDESKARKEKDITYDSEGKLKTGLTGRPAMYEIAKVLSESTGKDLDPAILRAEQVARINAILPVEEAAAVNALKSTLKYAEDAASRRLPGENGLHKLEQPLKLNLGGKPLNIGAIEVVDGQIYLKSAEDGTRYRAQPWLDAITEGLRERAAAKDGTSYSAKQALAQLEGNLEARVALVNALAKEYAFNTRVLTPPATEKAAEIVAGKPLRKGAGSQVFSGNFTPSGGAAEIGVTEGGGYKVTEKGGEKGGAVPRRFEEIPREEIAQMRERIMNEKKLSAEDRAASLRVLELAQEGDPRAREAIGRAMAEVKRGGFDKTTGAAVGVGIVVSALAGWYAYYKMQQAREPYVPKAVVR